MGRLSDEDRGLSTYLTAIQRFPPLDREEEQRISRRWQRDHERAAAHQLVCANLRNVVKIALGYRGYGFRLADLVEEGNVGLLEAVRRFDPERNLRFMTYASYWVRAYMLAHVLKQSSMVGVGTGPLQSKLFFRMAREKAKVVAALGADASSVDVEAHLARKFGTTPERIRAMSGRLAGRDHSLDAAAFRDGATTALDLLPDDRAEGTESTFARKERDHEVQRRVGALLAGLPSRERYIVHRRLLTDEADTLADIGRRLSLSRERVRQLEARLKGQLRRALCDLRPESAQA